MSICPHPPTCALPTGHPGLCPQTQASAPTKPAARKAALREAADVVHSEARWQAELMRRGRPATDPIGRLLVVETILRERAEDGQ